MLCFRHNHQLCATARFTYEWIEFCEIYEICGCWIFERKFIIKLYLKYSWNIENTIMSVINILCLYNSLESAIPTSQMWEFRRCSLSLEVKLKENLIKTLIDTSCVHFRSISWWKLKTAAADCRSSNWKWQQKINGSREQRSPQYIITFSKRDGSAVCAENIAL